ncbi:hypothetical protein, partial [Cecembia rubra]|uniref:hypothetical protein n=1 Tax=Cecembia rubra TaxID=1485585 RepID=UPI002715217E
SRGKMYNTIVASFPRRGVRLNENVNVSDLEGDSPAPYAGAVSPDNDWTADGSWFKNLDGSIR